MKRIITISIALSVLACGSTSGPGTEDTLATDKSPGQPIFNMNCALCHGRDGKLGLNGAKDLTTSTLTRPEMLAIVRSGKGAMMPYKNVLSPKEIEAVVEHVRTLGGKR